MQYNAIANASHAVVDAKEGGEFAHNVWAPAPAFFVGNQRYDIAGWKMAGHADDIAADPMWTDAAHGNFSVPPSSPLIPARAGITAAIHSATH